MSTAARRSIFGDMPDMSFSIPAALKAWAEKRVANGEYTSVSEFIATLIEQDQVRAQKIAAMQQLVTEGIESGVSPYSIDEIMEQARQRARDNGLLP